LVFLFAAIAAALYQARLLDVALIQQPTERSGVMAPLNFMAGYALATVLFLPGSVLTIAGGVLFGPVTGTPVQLDRCDTRRDARISSGAVPGWRLGGAPAFGAQNGKGLAWRRRW
jgi:uncharacterized membrane protein